MGPTLSFCPFCCKPRDHLERHRLKPQCIHRIHCCTRKTGPLQCQCPCAHGCADLLVFIERQNAVSVVLFQGMPRGLFGASTNFQTANLSIATLHEADQDNSAFITDVKETAQMLQRTCREHCVLSNLAEQP